MLSATRIASMKPSARRGSNVFLPPEPEHVHPPAGAIDPRLDPVDEPISEVQPQALVLPAALDGDSRICGGLERADEGTRTLDLLHGNPSGLPQPGPRAAWLSQVR